MIHRYREWQKKYRFTRKFKIIIGLLVCFIVLAGIAPFIFEPAINTNSQKASETMGNLERPSEKILRVKKGDLIETILGDGIIVPSRSYVLSFGDVSGTLSKLYVKAGDSVKAGDTIAVIHSGSLDLQMQQQKVEIKRCNLKIKEIVDQIWSIQNTLKQAEADYKRILESNKTAPRDEVDRLKILIEQENLQLDSANKERDMALMELNGAMLALKDIKTKLKECRMVAPVSGVVTYVDNVLETQYINNGQIIARVVGYKDVVLKVLSKDIEPMKYGTSCMVAVGDKSFNAEVYKPLLGQMDDFNINSSDLKKQEFFKINNLSQNYSINQHINVKLKLELKRNVLVIPKASIKYDGLKYFVEVLEGGKPVRREIKIGLETWNKVEVVEGLKEGEEIVY